MRPILKIFTLSMVTSLLCSCASTSLVDSWRNPGLQAQRLNKILVVKLSRDGGDRRIYEDVLVSELNQRRIEAVPGYTKLSGSERSNQKLLEAAVKEVGADAVLTIQTTNVERQTMVQPGYVSNYPGAWHPSAFPEWDLYGYYGATTYFQPPYVSTYDVATMQVNLFETRGGKLLWAATVQTSEPANSLTVSKELAKIVISSLVKEGLI